MSAQSAVKVSSLVNTNVVATTDAAIGVNKTFTPDGIDSKGVARWVDQGQTILIGRSSFSLSVRKPTSGSRMYKVTMKYIQPTLDVTSPSTGTGIQPAPSKAYEHQIVLECMLPERGTLQERKDIFADALSLFFNNIQASDGSPTDATNSPLYSAITNLEPVW